MKFSSRHSMFRPIADLLHSHSKLCRVYNSSLIAIEALGFRNGRIRLAGYLPDQDLLSYLAVGRYGGGLVREFADTTRKTGIVRAGGLVAVDLKRGRKGELGMPRHRHLHSGVMGVVGP